MEFQHHKCAYCEKSMPKGGYDKNEYDVEHYRPKNAVKNWPSQELVLRRSIDYADQIRCGAPAGYYLLGHDYLNYVVSCKTCNSPYKGNAFPIAGEPEPNSDDPGELRRKEKPLLPLPFGTWGEDPERFLTFQGPISVPKARSGRNQLRGKVVIDFFDLNAREDLILDRALMICALWGPLERRAADAATTDDLDLLEKVDGPQLPHANCARAFVKLHGEEPADAKEYYDACLRFLVSREPSIFA